MERRVLESPVLRVDESVSLAVPSVFASCSYCFVVRYMHVENSYVFSENYVISAFIPDNFSSFDAFSI